MRNCHRGRQCRSAVVFCNVWRWLGCIFSKGKKQGILDSHKACQNLPIKSRQNEAELRKNSEKGGKNDILKAGKALEHSIFPFHSFHAI
jgi:hypothetical protein